MSVPVMVIFVAFMVLFMFLFLSACNPRNSSGSRILNAIGMWITACVIITVWMCLGWEDIFLK